MVKNKSVGVVMQNCEQRATQTRAKTEITVTTAAAMRAKTETTATTTRATTMRATTTVKLGS